MDQLAAARTTEPWPPFLTALTLARAVYSVQDPTRAQVVAVRRACRSHPGVDTSTAETSVPAPRFGGRLVVRYVAVASAAASPGEGLARALFRERPGSDRCVLADAVGYRPPSPEAVVEALLKGAADKPICRVAPTVLTAAVDVVNTYAATEHTATGMVELHDAAKAAFTKRWGHAPWCCSPDPVPEQTEAEPDIATQWSAADRSG